ncbi:DUF3307 domain-containing protein [Arsenicitalea aurantiaca]|uniref:DUF3307 domain-containing protein n=1 Tax=Arsenicitalea aurantiaca TaxID=1783274 RepID=A0A433X7L0_9HYPH|nr:DUF3307 domain-containing protein [Arsenicitalea aurantiaca]RUT30042.1 DUF3307 domain-containing protein [Arsenicitalea aurantiaca]
MPELILLLLAGLQLKHFVADYLLQTPIMLAGKGDLGHPGGYAHAAVHLVGSALVLVWAGLPPMALIGLLALEFVLHYGLDYLKARYGGSAGHAETPRRYWALHGLDQFLHQLTYVGMLAMVVLILR